MYLVNCIVFLNVIRTTDVYYTTVSKKKKFNEQNMENTDVYIHLLHLDILRYLYFIM